MCACFSFSISLICLCSISHNPHCGFGILVLLPDRIMVISIEAEMRLFAFMGSEELGLLSLGATVLVGAKPRGEGPIP